MNSVNDDIAPAEKVERAEEKKRRRKGRGEVAEERKRRKRKQEHVMAKIMRLLLSLLGRFAKYHFL